MKNLPGLLDFHDGGSLRTGREQRLLAWRHARGQGEALSPDVPFVMPCKCGVKAVAIAM